MDGDKSDDILSLAVFPLGDRTPLSSSGILLFVHDGRMMLKTDEVEGERIVCYDMSTSGIGIRKPMSPEEGVYPIPSLDPFESLRAVASAMPVKFAARAFRDAGLKEPEDEELVLCKVMPEEWDQWVPASFNPRNVVLFDSEAEAVAQASKVSYPLHNRPKPGSVEAVGLMSRQAVELSEALDFAESFLRAMTKKKSDERKAFN